MLIGLFVHYICFKKFIIHIIRGVCMNDRAAVIFEEVLGKFFDSFSGVLKLDERSSFVKSMSGKIAGAVGDCCYDEDVYKKGFIKTQNGDSLPLFGIYNSIFYHANEGEQPVLYISGSDSGFGVCAAVLPAVTLASGGESISRITVGDSDSEGIRINLGLEKAVYCYAAAKMNCSADGGLKERLSLGNSVFLQIARIISFILNQEGVIESAAYTGDVTALCAGLSRCFEAEGEFIEVLRKMDELYRKCVLYERMVSIMPEDENRRTVLVYLNLLFGDIKLTAAEVNDAMLCGCFKKKMELASKYKELIMIKVQLDFIKNQFDTGKGFDGLMKMFNEQYMLLRLID